MIGEHDPWRECSYCGAPIGKWGCDCQISEPTLCEHPPHWRRSAPGLLGDGECQLCGASASTIRRERAGQMDTAP
mgnify:CR=1 FL=1